MGLDGERAIPTEYAMRTMVSKGVSKASAAERATCFNCNLSPLSSPFRTEGSLAISFSCEINALASTEVDTLSDPIF